MGTLGAGLVIYEIGFSGLQIAIQIVIGERLRPPSSEALLTRLKRT